MPPSKDPPPPTPHTFRQQHQKEKKGNDGGKNTGPPSLLFSHTQLVIRSPKQKAEGPLGWLCGASSIDLHGLHQSLAPDL